MSQIETATGGVGVVHVGPLEITVRPLSTKDERSLWKRFRAATLAKAKTEAASLFDGPNVARLLRSLAGVREAYLEAVRELTRLAAEKDRQIAKGDVSDEEFFAFRVSPVGVAMELYERGKADTPGLNLEELKLVITETNVDEVAEEMVTIIEAGPGKVTRSGSAA